MVSDSQLGTWADGDFGTTVSQYGGVGVDYDLPDESRFIVGVVRLLRRRKAELDRLEKTDGGNIAIFVLKPGPPPTFPGARREPMLYNGLSMVNGRVWSTAAAVASAHYVDLPQNASDDGLISFVTDDLDLGSFPTLIFDPRPASPLLLWYPEGLANLDNVEEKALSGEVSPQKVIDAIDRLYWECLITPGSLPRGGSLWNDSGKYWPTDDVESLVQAHLKVCLTSWFPFCTVRHEQTQQAGRTDLEIEENDPYDYTSITRHAVIELKVLRNFGSTGSVVSDSVANVWIEEGVLQAAGYRTMKSFRWSALCCFDMRRDDIGRGTCFAHVQQKAETNHVELWRWFLYASSASLRQALDNDG